MFGSTSPARYSSPLVTPPPVEATPIAPPVVAPPVVGDSMEPDNGDAAPSLWARAEQAIEFGLFCLLLGLAVGCSVLFFHNRSQSDQLASLKFAATSTLPDASSDSVPVTPVFLPAIQEPSQVDELQIAAIRDTDFSANVAGGKEWLLDARGEIAELSGALKDSLNTVTRLVSVTSQNVTANEVAVNIPQTTATCPDGTCPVPEPSGPSSKPEVAPPTLIAPNPVFVNPRPANRLGTQLDWAMTPADAYRSAEQDQKLVFMIHVSGNFEIPGFT